MADRGSPAVLAPMVLLSVKLWCKDVIFHDYKSLVRIRLLPNFIVDMNRCE